MIKAIISDFSLVLLFVKDKTYHGTLNGLHKELLEKIGSYSFFDYFELNRELLEFYRSQKSKLSVNIYTTGTIQNVPEVREMLEPVFDNIFSARDFNAEKSEPEGYKKIIKLLKIYADEAIFIDDQEENLIAASKLGIHTLRYRTNKELLEKLRMEYELY